jgi:hypothetical protein
MAHQNTQSKMKQATDTILKQDMNRREFLLYTVGAAAALTGIGSMTKALKFDKTQTKGFGTGAYGGNK